MSLETVNDSTWLGWIFGIIGTLIMTIFHVSVFGRIKKLEVDTNTQAAQIAELQILVAGKYVTREDLEKAIHAMERLNNAIFKKLDLISDKIDTKADKPHA